MNTKHGSKALVLFTLVATSGALAIGCGAQAEWAPAESPAQPPPVAMEPPPPPPAGAWGGAQAEARPAPDAPADKSRDGDWAPHAKKDRPGLGTEWGESRYSTISRVSFTRDGDAPFATAALSYNDEEGARAMSSASGFRRTTGGFFNVGGGAVSIGLRQEGGGFFNGFVAGGRDFVVGEAGHRYSIVLHNNTGIRLEVVLSVDGLDVMDGKSASFEKRGYLIDPHGELEVEGFRQSADSVAAFRFGSVRGSYANQKHGDTRNVGVIGVALFNERGFDAGRWNSAEIQRRKDANPFPGQFASPPPNVARW